MIFIKNNRLYDILHFIAMIALPGAGAAYFALAKIWNLPNAEQVVGSVTVVDGFLGIFLKKSSDNYNKSDAKYDGEMEVNENTGTAAFSSEDLAAAIDSGKKEVTLKVKKVPIKKHVQKVEDLELP